MNMTLSVDHRVSNGAEGAAFMNHMRELVENPLRLLDLRGCDFLSSSAEPADP